MIQQVRFGCFFPSFIKTTLSLSSSAATQSFFFLHFMFFHFFVVFMFNKVSHCSNINNNSKLLIKKVDKNSTSCHVASDSSQSVEQFCLHARFHKKQINVDLLRVPELSPEALVHPLGDFLWTAHHRFDVDFKTAV